VRIRHIPTDIAVKCTRERSQLQNKAIALEMLKVRRVLRITCRRPGRLQGLVQAHCHSGPGTWACTLRACACCLALRLWCQRGGVSGRMCAVMQAKLVVIAQEQQAAEIREIRGDVVKVPILDQAL
jgi:hypothetical protein